MVSTGMHIMENIVNLYKDRVKDHDIFTVQAIGEYLMDENGSEEKYFYDFHSKCAEFIGLCDGTIAFINKDGYDETNKAHKVHEVHETLTRRISYIEDEFKILLRKYEEYKIDHDSIYSGGNEDDD